MKHVHLAWCSFLALFPFLVLLFVGPVVETVCLVGFPILGVCSRRKDVLEFPLLLLLQGLMGFVLGLKLETEFVLEPVARLTLAVGPMLLGQAP
jgi:hypothetical protein